MQVGRHPVRGAIGGLLLGLGVTWLLVQYSLYKSESPGLAYGIVGGCTVLGILAGLYGPVRRRP